MTEKYEYIAALSQGLLSGIVGPQGWSMDRGSMFCIRPPVHEHNL